MIFFNVVNQAIKIDILVERLIWSYCEFTKQSPQSQKCVFWIGGIASKNLAIFSPSKRERNLGQL